MAQGYQRHDHDVDGEKPHRHERDLGADPNHARTHAVGVGHRNHHPPDDEKRQNGTDEASYSGVEPVFVADGLALSGLPRDAVRKAADEEEDRHHLEEPGQPP